MPPPKPTSIPSARPTGTPGRTALSSGTRGLKFMQRGAATKAASTPTVPDAATAAAAATGAAPATAASASSAESSAPVAAPKKVKGWLGVPQTGGESEWVLPSSGAAGADDAWGEVSLAAGTGADGKLEVEDSYLPFVLGRSSSSSAGASGSGGGKGGRWSYGGLNRDVEKLSAPPAEAPAVPGTAPRSQTSTPAAATAAPQVVPTEGGFLRPAAFASEQAGELSSNDGVDSSASDGERRRGGPSSSGPQRADPKGKARAAVGTVPSSSAPAAAFGKAKYAQGARGARPGSTASPAGAYDGPGKRGKKRPSSDAFDGVHHGGGGGLLSGLELGDAAPSTTASSSAYGSGDGGGGSGGSKKGRFQYDNGLRAEGGLAAAGRGGGGGGGGKSNRRK